MSAVEVVRKAGGATRLLCGAGIQSADDVTRAMELGSDGVLAASRIIMAEDPCAKIEEFAAAMSAKGRK
jgi:triosephosphate isomerase